MPPTREALLQTAHSVLKAYDTWDVDEILAFRDTTCSHQILPSSLGIPTMSNTEYAGFLKPMMSVCRNVKVYVRDGTTMVDTETQMVVMQLTSASDTPIGPYRNEYVLTLYMTEDEKPMVRKLQEFVDGTVSVEIMPKLKDWQDPIFQEQERHRILTASPQCSSLIAHSSGDCCIWISLIWLFGDLRSAIC